ncbi:MAG: MFS transporter [Methanomassiliicoccus sp.]|nr:MFS transporter [Methanomassiliicoccus sp.]
MATIKDGRGQALLLIAIVFLTTMDGMDASIVNIALPSIASSFFIDISTAAWVSLTYFMMMAGLLLVFGRLADRGIMKRALLAGLFIFTLFSLVCGVATTFEMLIIGRIFQGIGAAVMGACAPLLCVRYLPGNKLGLGMGAIAIGASIGYASGPTLGGFLTQYLSWHWIFIINVPIGVASILFLTRAIPKDESYARSYFDWPGSGLSIMGIITGVFAIERSSQMGFEDAQIVAAILICALSTGLFIIWEKRCKDPLLNPRIFHSWTFNSVLVAYLTINLVGTGIWYLTPFYLSLVMGFDSALSGIFMLIPPAVTLMISVPIGRWSDRYGRRLFSVISCMAMTLSSGILFIIDPAMGTIPLTMALIMMGVLWGTCGTAASRIVEKIETKEEGTGAALIAVATYLGASVGASFYAAFFSIFSGAGNTPFTDLDISVFLRGYHGVMLLGVAFALSAVVLSAKVKDGRHRPELVKTVDRPIGDGS